MHFYKTFSKTLWTCLCSTLLHLHQRSQIKLKKKIAALTFEILRAAEVLLWQRNPQTHTLTFPPAPRSSCGLESLITRIFSAVYTYKTRPPKTTMMSQMKPFSFVFQNGGKYSSLRITVCCSVRHKPHTVFIKSLSSGEILVWTAQHIVSKKSPIRLD